MFKSKRENKHKFIEIFGLSQSGKTTLLEKISKKIHVVSWDHTPSTKKFLLFLRFLIKNPAKSAYLFFKLNTNTADLNNLDLKTSLKIRRMRNSYLAGVLGKYESVLTEKKEVFVDEFLLQSVLMILHKKSNKKEISSVIQSLPPLNKIFLVETDSKTRYKRLNSIRFPGEQISRAYALVWMKNSEFNYKIIKEILLESYEKLKMPKTIKDLTPAKELL